MNTAKKLLIVSLVFVFAACSTVTSKQPVGLETIQINPTEWNGLWLCDGNISKIKVIDESKSIVKLAWFEEKDNDLEPHSMTLVIMKGKKWNYANVVEFDGEKTKDEFYWGRISLEKETIIFWHPSVKSFAEAAKSKKVEAIVHRKLPATNNGDVSREEKPNSVTLLGEPEDIVDLVENEGSQYFDWDTPATLTRIIK